MSATNVTMTFLFTDIEGSTRQWEESPAMADRVEHHFAVLRAAVAAAGGEVFTTLGDGIAAAFGSAESAVAAAVAAQRGLPATGLRVRMGVHTGDAERVDGDYRGRALNRAARVTAVGHGGQVLLSDVAAALVRRSSAPVELVDLGSHRLRDLTEPERLWQVVHPDLDESFPPVRGVDAYATNLPSQRSSLVGRERDVARVVGLLADQRAVTLTGVGGVGKTRLALQAAAELLSRRGQVWLVELADVTDPDDVADAVAHAVGLGASSDPLAAVVTALAERDALLVVDNCEHVLDAAADAIDALLAACPGVAVLATSREALGIDGEHVVAVRSLDPATAGAELFRQRAVAAGAERDALDDATIERICRRVDGIPLALELAAARTASLGVATVDRMLDDRLGLLGGVRRRAVDRHCTMRATVDWSYRLLSAEEQQLFRGLAVFSNGFELDAVAHVAGAQGTTPGAATDQLASLVHKSMVIVDPAARPVRYRLLETMRAFALEKLDEAGERPAAAGAHARWVTVLSDLPLDRPGTPEVERNTLRLEREADNWRAAATFATQQGDAALAAALCGPPALFFLLGRHDLVDVVRPLAALAPDDPWGRVALIGALLVASAGSAGPDEVGAWLDEIVTADEVRPTGVSRIMGWLVCVLRGDFAGSVEICAAGSLDPRLEPRTRDLLLGIAALDHFSLTATVGDPHGLLARSLAAIDRAEVALTRVSCLLGAAWGLAAVEPDRALGLVRRALDDLAGVPALPRRTLPGNASRLLARLDPQVAAQGLLQQIGPVGGRNSVVDLVPVLYATILLDRVGHPVTGRVLAAVPGPPLPPFPSMMDIADMARRAVTTSSASGLDELRESVRAALVDVASGTLVGAAT